MVGQRVGIYGGTFDPFHLGHLALAVSMQEAAQLDEVWLLPALHNPLRKQSGEVSFQHRLAMTQAAVNEVPYIKALALEGDRTPPSYTIDTVELLQKKYPNHQFYLILGGDTAAYLNRWHRSEELVEMVELLVGHRSLNVKWQELQQFPKLWHAVEKGCCNTPRYDISATEIRERLKKQLYCGHLIPNAVMKYIKENKIYT